VKKQLRLLLWFTAVCVLCASGVFAWLKYEHHKMVMKEEELRHRDAARADEEFGGVKILHLRQGRPREHKQDTLYWEGNR